MLRFPRLFQFLRNWGVQKVGGDGGASTGSFLLLESGSYLLIETGDKIILE